MRTYFLILLCSVSILTGYGQNNIPHLQAKGNTYELIIKEQPFLMLAGELGNSTATSTESMASVWPKLQKENLNTVLVPVYWELLEPEEGKFDFKLVDALIKDARKQNIKIVFLWFGSWKNSMSSHAPGWVKTNTERFPRATDNYGVSQEILTPFSDNNLNADRNAYRMLLTHIKEKDHAEQTVILIQTENEIGMLPSARDYSPLANQKFNADVPKTLMEYLVTNKEKLSPELYAYWKENGFRETGSWERVFGKGLHTDELFMAYYFGLYTDKVAEAGKEAYALPCYVNAALNRPGVKPGDYPSAGPLPHVLDLWKAAAPHIDFFAPDFYNTQFKHWSDLYSKNKNPLFIPEHQFDNTVAAKALFAIGHYGALGFSPFSIEQVPGNGLSTKEEKLSKTYELIAQVKPLLDANRGKERIEGVLLDKDLKNTTFVLGDYEFEASHTFNLGWEPNIGSNEWDNAGAIIIQTGGNEFYYIGFGISLKMRNIKKNNMKTGILKAERGYFKDGNWMVFQHLNGDQTHQGRHIRSFIDDVCIQRFALYEY